MESTFKNIMNQLMNLCFGISKSLQVSDDDDDDDNYYDYQELLLLLLLLQINCFPLRRRSGLTVSHTAVGQIGTNPTS